MTNEELYNQLAIEAMTQAIYAGEREDYNVKASYLNVMPEAQAFRIEEDEQLEHECFVEAVDMAVSKYEELSGQVLPAEPTTWDRLSNLPLFKDIK